MENYNFEVTTSPSGMVTVMLLRGGNDKMGMQSKKMSIEDMKKEVIKNHLERVERDKLNEAFEANFKGLTVPQLLKHKLYSHCRRRDYGITIYAHASHSPSGVISIGGMSYVEEAVFKATGLI